MKLFNANGVWINPDNIVSARARTYENGHYVDFNSVSGADMHVKCQSHKEAYTLLDNYVRHCDEN